jgi:hypothetical protein
VKLAPEQWLFGQAPSRLKGFLFVNVLFLLLMGGVRIDRIG